MKNAFVLVAALFSTMSFANDKMIDCIDAGDEMSWHVYLKSDLSIGNFFDNNTDTAIRKTDVNFYETYPPQTEFKFIGQKGQAKIKFEYIQETKKGLLTANVGTKDQFETAFECTLVEDDIDWSSVQAELETASGAQ